MPFDPLLDAGVAACNGDPAAATSNIRFASGTMGVARLHTTRALTVTHLALLMAESGSSLTSGQCKMALYDTDGDLLGTSVDMSNTWMNGGVASTMVKAALTASAAVPVGDFYVGAWTVGTTRPLFARYGTTRLANAGSSPLRWGTGATGLTTTAPATMGTLTSDNYTYWAAVTES